MRFGLSGAAGLFALLALGACAPSATEVPAASSEAAACAARGGVMRPVGRAQSVRCIVRHADAGRACTDAGQCQGECLAAAGARPDEAGVVHGVCSTDSNRFGCRTVIRDGKARPTICVD